MMYFLASILILNKVASFYKKVHTFSITNRDIIKIGNLQLIASQHSPFRFLSYLEQKDNHVIQVIL